MTSQRKFNRQQSVMYSLHSQNIRAGLATTEHVEPPEPIYKDFITPNEVTSNEMIFRERPPDIIELFEKKKPSGNLFYDGVWSGQFFPLQSPEAVEDDENDDIQGVHLAQCGLDRPKSSRVIRNDFAVESRRNTHEDDVYNNKIIKDDENRSHFRVYGSSMALQERYSEAIQKSWSRGQSQKTILQRVRSKFSEKIESYAAHRIRMRKKFEYFDKGNKRSLLELEFRHFLDEMNCYLDEVESLALFAYLDVEQTGHITWKSFEQYCLVRDASCGSAIIPKAITGQK